MSGQASRRRSALVEVRCPGPERHWLAGVYRDSGGRLMIRCDPKTVLHDHGGPLFSRVSRALPEVDMAVDDGPLWQRCCLRGRLGVFPEELADAAARAVAEGRTQVVIAWPVASGRPLLPPGAPGC